MAYSLYLDGVLLPITPSKIQTKIKNQNKTINLINDGEVNLLKSAGLTTVNFQAIIPQTEYPFATYERGFKNAEYFLNKIEQLKNSEKPFQFICSRVSPSGQLLFDTNIKVSLEDYTIIEDVKNGFDLIIKISLKQYKDFGTKTININTQKVEPTATVQNTRSTDSAPAPKTYKVRSGDSLWIVAKKCLGDGSRYSDIANLNKDKIINANVIYTGQVLTLPS